MSAFRLWHTVRWLRAGQIAGQLRQRLRAVAEDPSAFARRPVPAYPGCRWQPRADFLSPSPAAVPESVILEGSLAFLNRSERIGWPPDWNRSDLPLLWRYNLHYFDFVWSLGFEHAASAARDWIARHPLARGRVGWASYPISLRLQNWCAYFFGRHRERTEADHELRAALWGSIQLQTDWLGRRLETQLLGNHLFENGAALALTGACFAGPRAEKWARDGRAILAAQIPEQVLADGGHFERSPMYLQRLAWVLTTLLESGDPELSVCVAAPLQRMMGAISDLCHPDGGIALLNDSAFGITVSPAELRRHWERVSGLAEGGLVATEGCFALPETGYYGARSATGGYVVCDAAPIGPDYQPGHAHGDLFSFELSLGGRRVVVDAGVYGYEEDDLRRYCRSTRAHNTVEVEGKDQSEFWAVFRVARRGRPRDVRWEPRAGGFRLSGWHDGYQRLRGRPRHSRSFAWRDDGVLMVRDEVRASRPVRVASRLHLHPDCEIAELTEDAAHVRHPGGAFSVRFGGPGELGVEDSVYCPEFGRELANRALVYSFRGERTVSGFCIAPGDQAPGYDLTSGAHWNSDRFAW